jgi:YidC/Oxa1 family membrane protein insertase
MNDALGRGFLWVADLSKPDLLGPLLGMSEGIMAAVPGILPIFAALTTYLQMATMGTKGQQNDQMKTMTMFMPVMILFMGKNFSAGLMIYWTVSNLFQMAQQHFINRLAKEEAK